MEIEYKLRPKGIYELSKKRVDDALAKGLKKLKYKLLEEKDLTMKSSYLDDKQLNLIKGKNVFRIRQEGNELVLTGKFGGSEENGLFKRHEVDFVKTSNSKDSRLKDFFLLTNEVGDFKLNKDEFVCFLHERTEKTQELTEQEFEKIEEAFRACSNLSLGCVVRMEFKRHIWLLDVWNEETNKRVVVELALDIGQSVNCYQDYVPIYEMEIEYKLGNENVMDELVEQLMQCLQLEPEHSSKLVRGLGQHLLF